LGDWGHKRVKFQKEPGSTGAISKKSLGRDFVRNFEKHNIRDRKIYFFPFISIGSLSNKVKISARNNYTIMSSITSTTNKTNNDAYDSYDEAWRLDPQVSFSDWTIKVTRKTDETKAAVASIYEDSDPTVKYYHVHRVHLVTGKVASEYFRTLFSTRVATEESHSGITELVLPHSAFRAFPTFLDCLYRNDTLSDQNYLYDIGTLAEKNYDVSSDVTRVVAVAHLADYFDVPSLLADTNAMIPDLITTKTIDIIAREALLYNFDWIIGECTAFAATCPDKFAFLELLPTAEQKKHSEMSWQGRLSIANRLCLNSEQRQSGTIQRLDRQFQESLHQKLTMKERLLRKRLECHQRITMMEFPFRHHAPLPPCPLSLQPLPPLSPLSLFLQSLPPLPHLPPL